jgi:hypothetical protein
LLRRRRQLTVTVKEGDEPRTTKSAAWRPCKEAESLPLFLSSPFLPSTSLPPFVVHLLTLLGSARPSSTPPRTPALRPCPIFHLNPIPDLFLLRTAVLVSAPLSLVRALPAPLFFRSLLPSFLPRQENGRENDVRARLSPRRRAIPFRRKSRAVPNMVFRVLEKAGRAKVLENRKRKREIVRSSFECLPLSSRLSRFFAVLARLAAPCYFPGSLLVSALSSQLSSVLKATEKQEFRPENRSLYPAGRLSPPTFVRFARRSNMSTGACRQADGAIRRLMAEATFSTRRRPVFRQHLPRCSPSPTHSLKTRDHGDRRPHDRRTSRQSRRRSRCHCRLA